MASKIELGDIKDYYVKHNITLKDISNIFNVNYDTLKKRACNEKWQEQKDKYQFDLRQDLLQNMQETDYNAIENIDLETIDTIRVESVYKSYILLEKALSETLPTELNKIKQITNMLSELDKILNDRFEKRRLDRIRIKGKFEI